MKRSGWVSTRVTSDSSFITPCQNRSTDSIKKVVELGVMVKTATAFCFSEVKMPQDLHLSSAANVKAK